MARYIDTDVLQKSLQYVCTGGGKWGEAERMYIEAFSDFVDGFPAHDVIEVVRCKDCKHRDDDAFCSGRGWPTQLVPDDGFCDKGMRREDGEIH